MLGIANRSDDLTRCRYCGEKLSLLQRLSRAEYCNTQHKEAFHRDQEKLALDRLQQVVNEGRESELYGRLGRGRVKEEGGGEWPEEATPVGQSAGTAPAAAGSGRSMGGVTYDAPEEDGPPGPPFCGPICRTDIAAPGQVSPLALRQQSIEVNPMFRRLPETPNRLPVPKVNAAPGLQMGFTVPAVTGERQGRQPECRDVRQTRAPMRFPALGLHSMDWSEAIERARQEAANIPPLAGLIQIAGPQTLRFQSGPRAPMPLPEHPAGNPVRAYKPGLARGAGVPSLAGAVRGLGTWRTRFGSEGSLQPLWESSLFETASLTPEWKPRYPVFYTTSPWSVEGLDQVFGLGPGNGPGPDAEESEAPPVPKEVTGPLAYSRLIEAAPSTPAAPLSHNSPAPASASTGEAGGNGGNGAPGPIPAPGGSGFLESRQGSGTGNGPGNGVGTGTSGGSGLGAGAGTGTGTGWGSGDGRGVVSAEAVAALVRAARQSDRSRMPLRDIEIGLLDRPSLPRMAAPRPWRRLSEASARKLPDRGPVWTKAPYALPAATMEIGRRTVALEHAPISVTPCPAPAGPPAVPALPALRLASAQDWSEAWLAPVPGPPGLRGAGSFDWQAKPRVQPPEHVAAKPATGGAGRIQPPLELPEPWVEVQEQAAQPASVPSKPFQAVPAEPRVPVRPPVDFGAADRRLGYGEIERPGNRWVLLRGSGEAATFRLALDHLRLQEPGSPCQAEWGPVKSPRPGAKPAGLPPSRGIVHRELCLQRVDAEPLLEPVVCLFGSARGGSWESRK